MPVPGICTVQWILWMFLIFCYSSAKTVKASVNGRTHAYLFDATRMTGHGKERTHKETLEHAQMANSFLLQGKQTPIFGVEGTTWFMSRALTLSEGLHSILLGVMTMLLNLWFDRAHIGMNHFMYAAKSKQLIVGLL